MSEFQVGQPFGQNDYSPSNETSTASGKTERGQNVSEISPENMSDKPAEKSAKKVHKLLLGILTLGYGLGVGYAIYCLVKHFKSSKKPDVGDKVDVQQVKESLVDQLSKKNIRNLSKSEKSKNTAKRIFHRLHTKHVSKQLISDSKRNNPTTETSSPRIELEGHNRDLMLADIKDDLNSFMQTDEFKELDPGIQSKFNSVKERFVSASPLTIGTVLKGFYEDPEQWNELCEGPIMFNYGTSDHNMTMKIQFYKDNNELKADIMSINTGLYTTSDSGVFAKRTEMNAIECKGVDASKLFKRNSKHKTFFQALNNLKRDSYELENSDQDYMKPFYEDFGMQDNITKPFTYMSQGSVGICTYKSISVMMHQEISPKTQKEGLFTNSQERDNAGNIAWEKFKLHCLKRDLHDLNNEGVQKYIEDAPLEQKTEENLGSRARGVFSAFLGEETKVKYKPVADNKKMSKIQEAIQDKMKKIQDKIDDLEHPR